MCDIAGKVCTCCREIKSFEDFSVDKHGKHDSWCRECYKLKARQRQGYTAERVRPEPIIQGLVSLIPVKAKNKEWVWFKIDTCNLERVMKHGWSLNAYGYARANLGNNNHEMLHRFILNLKKHDGNIVDHIDGCPDNNTESNLRLVDKAENAVNVKRQASNNTTGFRGIGLSNGKWYAQFKWKGRIYYKGGFATPEEAAHQYDLFVIEHGPPLAKLNFPERHGR